MTKSNLEAAIEKQAGKLEPAQKELVLSQFNTYQWNRKRIKAIESRLTVISLGREVPAKGERKSLMTERHQLTTENVSISSKLFQQLKDTGDKTDEFDKFMAGE